MARAKSITSEALAALGAETLAEVLIEHAESDPVLRKRLRMRLAGTEGPGKLAAEIDKRVRTIGRSRSFVDWEKRKPLVQELDHLRTTIAGPLAAQDPEGAIERLWNLIGIADSVTDRLGEGVGDVEEIFLKAMADLGRLYAAQPSRDRRALARRVLAACEGGGLGSGDALIRHLGEALGAEGRAELRQAAEAALKALPSAKDWREESSRRRLGFRLALLADLDKDTDAYIAAIRAGGMETTHAIEAAERLIAANRPEEALEWLDRPRQQPGYYSEYPDDTAADLRIVALEALGRADEAQTLRWRTFAQTLSTRHLRDHLKRLPDFEDFTAEQKALGIAAAHPQAEAALAFLVAWPALDRADRLVRERLAALDGRDYRSLRPAAEALEEKYPETATLLYRRMIESVLDRGSSTQYPYAAQDLQSCVRLAARLPAAASIESHAAFLARLQKAHGRKCGFWGLVNAAQA